MKHIGYRPANLEDTKNASGVNVTGSGISTNKTGKPKDKSMEVEDRAGAPDAVAANSSDISVRGLVGIGGLKSAFKIAETDAIANKSSNVLVGGLEDASKMTETDAVAARTLDVLV